MSRAEVVPLGAKQTREAQEGRQSGWERFGARRAGAMLAGLLLAVAADSAVSAKDLVGV